MADMETSVSFPEAVTPVEEYQRLEPLINEPLKAGSAYFLVNRRWYMEWLQWVGAPSVQSPQMRPADPPLEGGFEMLSQGSVGSSRKKPRASSWTKDRPGQIDNSELLEEGSSTAIKSTLDEHSDYRIVPEDAWDLLFGWYGGGPPIKRRAITPSSGGVQVELYGLSLKVYRSTDLAGVPLEVIESKCCTIRQLKAELCAQLGMDASKVRIWDYFNEKPFTLLESYMEDTLESRRIMQQNEILLEEQEADGSWSYREDSTSAVETYGTSTTAGYSSNWLASSASDVPVVGEPIQRGAVGLQNLGNTCFMNSSIQCLSNIPQLREFFLTGTYKAALNPTAHKTHGKLAETFAELLELMWKDNTIKVAPRNFKWQVGQFAEQFSGYGQQDSMELIEYVLDGLKEDCNSVQGCKPYIELKEADGRPDAEVAAEALSAYRQRSSSRVDDLFVGLFKSVVRCPDLGCGRTSVTFDPFLSAKLSLSSSAEQRQTSVSLVLVRDCDLATEAYQQVKVKVNKEASVKELIEAAAEEVGAGLKPSRCMLVEVWNKKVYKFFEEPDSIENIRAEDHLLLSEVSDAKAFCKSGEQRWGSTYITNSLDDDSGGGGASPSSSSSCGVILHHRKASSNSIRRDSSPLGVPLLMTIPKDATARLLYKQVDRYIKRLAGEVDSAQAWRLHKTDGQLIDPEGDLPLGIKESREHFAIEWQEELPEKVLQEPFSKTNGSVSDGEVDLTHLLEMFVQDEKLGLDDAWYCNRCKEHKEAFKKLEFHHCPPVLVLQLKRFQYTRWYRDRLNAPVNFPLHNLDLTSYCTASSRESFKIPPVYDLAALSKHIGSLGGGHYVAYARSSIDGEWYHYDDSSVRRCSEEEVSSDKVGAYVLFYIRRDYRPPSYGPPEV
ncbi:unnamed protein product [Effrenium voratum]|nr:unnamed protein product [Effrenium voratum]